MTPIALFLALAGVILGWIALGRITALTARNRSLETRLHELGERVARLETLSIHPDPVESPLAAEPELQVAPDIAPGPETFAADPVPPPFPSIPSAPSVPPPLPAPGIFEYFKPAENPTPAIPTAVRKFALEQFVGARLFAWLGGLALFFAAALGLKYSFDHGWIAPWLRASGGFLLGAGLVAGGSFALRRNLEHTATTLWGTGVVILYAVLFACRSLYSFALFTPAVTLVLMSGVTVLAFGLAVRHSSQVVAILGFVGGFLTPILLSTGNDQPLALFGYIALLDLGLIAVTAKRRWDYLSLLGALGTAFFQLGWFATQFRPEKIGILQGNLILFPLLFAAAFAWACRKGVSSSLLGLASSVPAITALSLTLWVAHGSSEIASRPSAWCWAMLVADLSLCLIAGLRREIQKVEMVGGGLAFLILSTWTLARVSSENLYWALGLFLVYAVIHGATPVAWRRMGADSEGSATTSGWHQIAPAFSILLTLVCVIREMPMGTGFWLVLIVLNMVAVGIALAEGGIVGILAALVLTLGLTATWLVAPRQQVPDLAESLFAIGGFALFFVAVSAFLFRRFGDSRSRTAMALPGLSAALPFMLLLMATVRLRPSNPSPVLGLALILSVILLILQRWQGIPALGPVALGCVSMVQAALFALAPAGSAPTPHLVWASVFAFVFLLHPFALRITPSQGRAAWASAALSAPLQFLFVWWVTRSAWNPAWPGLLTLPFIAAVGLVIFQVVRAFDSSEPGRLAALAWLGGALLFLVTAIAPLELHRQWLTIGLAIEGLALCFLFHKLPHWGLRGTGISLLGVAAVRLLSHRVLFGLDPRPESAWNWFLYAFGSVIVCLFVAARVLAPPRDKVLGSSVPPLLRGLGTLLGFVLLNLEIATVFGTGPTIAWEFSGNFSRDLAYSIGWALFAFVMLIAGFIGRAKIARYAGLALLGLTLGKLFLHDLSRLGPLHRIGAFAAVSVVAIVASILYQRFQGPGGEERKAEPGP